MRLSNLIPTTYQQKSSMKYNLLISSKDRTSISHILYLLARRVVSFFSLILFLGIANLGHSWAKDMRNLFVHLALSWPFKKTIQKTNEVFR